MLVNAEQGWNPGLSESQSLLLEPLCLTLSPSQGPRAQDWQMTRSALPAQSVLRSALWLPNATANMATKTHVVLRLQVLTQHVNYGVPIDYLTRFLAFFCKCLPKQDT